MEVRQTSTIGFASTSLIPGAKIRIFTEKTKAWQPASVEQSRHTAWFSHYELT